jgi:hypothetical protein
MGIVLGIVYRTLATHITIKAGYNKKTAQKKINRTSMIINCKATPLVGKTDAFDLPSTQSSPIIL